MKNDKAKIKKLLQALSKDLLGRPMTKQDAARFDRKWKAAQKISKAKVV